MKLIVNGDDFAYTKGVTLGILEAFQKGILRSTTALVNSEDFAWSINKAEECPGIGIGVHLNLTIGKPLTESSSLTDPETGEFYKSPKDLLTAKPILSEVYSELRTQIDTFVQIAGKKPTHLDFHHLINEFDDGIKDVTFRLSREYDLKLRGHSTYKFVGDFTGNDASEEKLIGILEKHRGEDIEIMSHPGWCDLDLLKKSSYSFGRVNELQILCGESVKKYIDDNGIVIENY